MSFDTATPPVPTTIGDIELTLEWRVEGGVSDKLGTYNIRVLDAGGDPIQDEFRRGDLKAYLLANAPAVAQKLSEILDWARSEAETKILP